MPALRPLCWLLAFVVLILHGSASAQPRPKRPFVFPPALEKGDTVALVAPARPVSQESADKLRTALEAQGYRVKPAGNITTVWKYLAGSDEDRAAGINAAFADPEVDALFCVAGGFGSTRMMDQLDYKLIRKNPKIVTGFSDVTGLHLALNRRAGLVSFHAPNNHLALANNTEERPFAARGLWTLIDADAWGNRDPEVPFTIPTDGITTPMLTLTPGRATGRLVGGNLSLLAATMGTPFEIETDGCILFIEDLNEDPYRVDRMLSTLRLGGKFDELSGVVIGYFSDCAPDDPNDSFTVDELFEQYFKGRGYPVLMNYPVGHERPNATLPLGVRAELDATAQKLSLLEPPVRLPKRDN